MEQIFYQIFFLVDALKTRFDAAFADIYYTKTRKIANCYENNQ